MTASTQRRQPVGRDDAWNRARRTIIDFANETVYVLPERRLVPERRPRAVARPRERRAHRSAASTRAGPDDDPAEPELASDALAFGIALRSHLRAVAAVLESEHREVGGITPASYEVLAREVHSLRYAVAAFIEAERVALAVGAA
jgi:hypothetical protein